MKGRKEERTRSLDLATIHSKHDSRAPVQEALGYSVADEFDGFAGETAKIKLVIVGVYSQVFEEDGGSLDRFLTERSLAGG